MPKKKVKKVKKDKSAKSSPSDNPPKEPMAPDRIERPPKFGERVSDNLNQIDKLLFIDKIAYGIT